MIVREKIVNRERRRRRVRAKISGSAARPRLSIFRSNRFLSVQLIDDQSGRTLCSASTREFEKNRDRSDKTASDWLGREIARRAAELKISQAVFDRGGYRYAGKIKRLAEAARQAGMNF